MIVSTFRGSYLDPLHLGTRLANKIFRTLKFRGYPFASIGKDVFIHRSCELAPETARYVSIGNNVKIEKDVWLNIPEIPRDGAPVIVLADGCRLNRRCMISARNHVYVGRDVMFGASVLLMDHNHAYENVHVPIAFQGMTRGGSIRIEDGCWIGFGAAIVASESDIVIGRNSVIGANAVISKSIPPFSVFIGNPGRVVKQYDVVKEQWVLGHSVNRPDQQNDPEKL